MQTFYLETLEESIQRSKLAKYRQMNQSKDELATSKVASSVITEEETSEEDFDEHADASAHFDELQDELSETFKLLQSMSKSDRLVEWNVEILSYLLKQIMVARPEHQQEGNKAALVEFEDTLRGERRGPTNVLEEFQEIIELPSIEPEELLQRKHPDTVTLSPIVVDQLRDLLQNIASMYNDNAFHNFEHASHVTGKFLWDTMPLPFTEISKPFINLTVGASFYSFNLQIISQPRCASSSLASSMRTNAETPWTARVPLSIGNCETSRVTPTGSRRIH
jgi:cell fate (sporulation/competence/biofilm development) regulator YlbF (YheA/YmcA/DUF963 family)